MDGLSGFPSTLSLEQQGQFALGYYHQRQDFFKKHDIAPGNDDHARPRKALPLALRPQVADTEHDDVLLGERPAITDLGPVPRVAVARGHG